jgi:23S rRNA (adenine2503-C2)-methyltransferase
MLPVNRRYPISDLMEACADYVRTTHRRLTFEWALIRDVNDTPEEAARLAELLQIFRLQGESGRPGDLSALCHVNVIPLNPTRQYEGQATTRERAEAFQQVLEQRGIPCTIRMRRGIDIQAGCGQLAIEHKEGQDDRPSGERHS